MHTERSQQQIDQMLQRLGAESGLAREALEEPELFQAPGLLARVARVMGYEPRLINAHASTIIQTPLGRMLSIPVQIGDEKHGRSSIFYLNAGEEALAGYLIDTNFHLYERWYRRLDGEQKPCETGDKFAVYIKGPMDVSGEKQRELPTAWSGEGQMVMIDREPAAGMLRAFRHSRFAGENLPEWWICVSVPASLVVICGGN